MSEIIGQITTAGEIIGHITGGIVQGASLELLSGKADKTTTVNTKPLSGDISLTATDIPSTPSGGISATDVQTAINELDNEKANKAQEAWITPTLESGFTGTVQYRKNNFGLVEFRGYIRAENTGKAFTLPQGYRPKDASRLFLCPNSNSATAARRIDVSGLGAISLYGTSESIYVDNIRFYGEV